MVIARVRDSKSKPYMGEKLDSPQCFPHVEGLVQEHKGCTGVQLSVYVS